MSDLELAFGLSFADLYETRGVEKIDSIFLGYLKQEDVNLYIQITESRDAGEIGEKEYSNLIVNISPYVEKFIGELFSISNYIDSHKKICEEFDVIAKCKRLFVQRQAVKKYIKHDWQNFDYQENIRSIKKILGEFSELNFALKVNQLLENKEENIELINLFEEFAAWAVLCDEARGYFPHTILFSIPKKRDHMHMVECEHNENSISTNKSEIHSRDKFSLTDNGPSLEKALDNAHYCIYCHNQGKDSCSKGLKNKDGEERFKKNEFNENLIGCPLEEKISEMNFLKANGYIIAPLVAATIDNPLLAATGHRICNDCMKSCIYQKQDPVNIPQVESRILHDVLQIDWGFEIYSLLTRWNPLHIKRPYPKNDTGKNILVVGLGPAGFNLSHHLNNEGHNICAIDALKIEPIDKNISGVTIDGSKQTFVPIKNVSDIFVDLDERAPEGFGGVAEYGITVRWNKNNLKIIRLLLERRHNFRLYGGVRFGSQIDYKTAKEMGFDHIALAMGAGKPNLLNLDNSVAKGIRTASDFLMALQLTGAAREKSFANMQIRLPIIVIGGGLTAIDTATEAMAYYVRQVNKFAARHQILTGKYGEEAVTESWDTSEKEIAEEFLLHSELFVKEKYRAKKENRKANYAKIIHELGGVKILYRKRFVDAPCYRLNPEEVSIALEEGIAFVENAIPKEIIVNNEHLEAVRVERNGKDEIFLAKNMFLAIGTSPNIVAAKEDAENFILDGKYFRAINSDGEIASPERIAKPSKDAPLMKIDSDGFAISFFGDLHPSYSGNVVKAMASAKNGYPQITEILKRRESKDNDIFSIMNKNVIARVAQVNLLGEKIVEVVLHAPLAAKKFSPGQFYRLQNYENIAFHGKDGSVFAMEGLAMTGAWVDEEKGLISVIALEMGGSSDLCRFLQKGEHVILMGPTGEPTEIKSNENVVLVGGGLGNAVLFSIGKAFRKAGSKVLYFAGYRDEKDVCKIEEIEAAADKVIWCSDIGEIETRRRQDSNFRGNIVEAIDNYCQGKFSDMPFTLKNMSRLIAIGSQGMMDAVNKARASKFREYLPTSYDAVASINSPMQCMMKEVCAQCLQKHVDPNTNIETYVYSCANQDQDMDKVDFNHLKNRLEQNSLLEKQTKMWLDISLKEINLR